ncbi:MAG: glucose-1-phosphate thymidylyltransferase RfbA [Lutibacter sp.]|nr:glucose-1-phosphate thymidylyltransferase RfbA [Lutibacter sp.]
MKGIILAGGSGTRLFPLTIAVSKQLLPVYDKPMIYYPLSVLMLAGIREILIITTPHDQTAFKKLLGDGSQYGCKFEFVIQQKPNGLAEAFIIGEEFIGNEDVCLILGDNIIYSDGLTHMLSNAIDVVKKENKSTVFGYYVSNPKEYGVCSFDKEGNVDSIEEKPQKPKSNFAVIGLYFYPNDVINIAKKLKPSRRGELEITSVNQEYLNQKRLKIEIMGRGVAWLDTGNYQSLLEASNFIQTIEKRQSLKVACLEEIAFKRGFIGRKELITLAKNKPYLGEYLRFILNNL